tara:strand:+ start:34214 stop:34441 length:228 start_codon:yes stop_codon:yes gene_type:complete
LDVGLPRTAIRFQGSFPNAALDRIDFSTLENCNALRIDELSKLSFAPNHVPGHWSLWNGISNERNNVEDLVFAKS